MPKYLARFDVESPLTVEHDLQFQYRDHTITFLFRSENNTHRAIEVEIECQGKDYLEAIRFVSNQIIPPVLDAIAFHRKTTLSLGMPTRVLKAESGQRRRKIVLIDIQKHSDRSILREEWIEEIQRIIECDPDLRGLALRWLRTSYRPGSVLDHFIHTWLALETLAGQRDMQKKCPRCEHKLPSYKAANRKKAYSIVRAFDAELSEWTFNDWWNRLRNSVFHGGKEPDAQFFAELGDVKNRIGGAVESWLQKKVGIVRRNPAQAPLAWERQLNMLHFLEFDTPDLADEFSQVVPDLLRLRELRDSGKSDEEELGTHMLSQEDFRDW